MFPNDVRVNACRRGARLSDCPVVEYPIHGVVERLDMGGIRYLLA